MKTHNEIDEGNKIAKKMFYFLLISILPMLLIIATYIYNPTSGMLKYIELKASDLPSIYSLKNSILSKTLSTYVKTAPFVAFILFLTSHKNLRLKKDSSVHKALTIQVLFSIFYAILIYTFLLTNTELTKSAKLLKLMSTNDFYLSFFYISLYSGIYVFSYLYMWFFIGTYRILKERC
ncbi:colicin immunity protein [Salmonella enterica subsp. enterica]|nr:colicin immunity protein Cui [Salmonella enterica subsp. enterica]PUO16563.1 colicin immunity protein [Salmonella enterica subsp. enterica]